MGTPKGTGPERNPVGLSVFDSRQRAIGIGALTRRMLPRFEPGIFLPNRAKRCVSGTTHVVQLAHGAQETPVNRSQKCQRVLSAGSHSTNSTSSHYRYGGCQLNILGEL